MRFHTHSLSHPLASIGPISALPSQLHGGASVPLPLSLLLLEAGKRTGAVARERERSRARTSRGRRVGATAGQREYGREREVSQRGHQLLRDKI